METLAQRLNLIQESILTLIEKGSTLLLDQIEYWKLVRKEQALLHHAKDRGLTRVGLTHVPPKQVSQARAKEAIEQEMYLQSLYESPYGIEPWNMSQTSREAFLAAPKYTFKKQASSVDIEFDGDSLNSVRETGWSFIYAQDEDGRWHKYVGAADDKGLYYVDKDGDRWDYVDFGALARRYGTTGRYKVLIGDTVIADVASSAPSPVVAVDSSPRPRTQPQRTPQRTGGRRRRRIRTPAPKGTRQQPAKAVPRANTTPPKAPRADQGSSAVGTPPSAREVGGRHTTVPATGRSRLQRLLAEARDPPALVLTGQANSVKCLRFRLKKSYSKHFQHCSTTWWWTGPKGKERVGEASMLVMFKSVKQRQGFVLSVPLPPTIRSHAVSFFE